MLHRNGEGRLEEQMPEIVAEDGRPEIRAVFDPGTSSLTYVVVDPATRHAAIFDPVLDYDARAGRVGTRSINAVAAAAAGLTIDWIIDTHIHADHLSGVAALQARLGGRTGIGHRTPEVQTTWKSIYNLGDAFRPDGSQFDHRFADGEEFRIGSLRATALDTPGHTPGCQTFVVGDAAFVGDTLFMPDSGTARADFPGGDAATLYRSIRRVLSLPETIRVHVCHDYQPEGRALAWEASVAEQRRSNIHVHDGVGEAEFVAMRTKRDKTLSMPALLLSAIQVNIRAGRLPPPEDDGRSYLKIPIDRF